MIETHPLGNFLPENMKYLLLGSFAAKDFGIAEEYNWYYSTRRNQFWPILEEVYETELKTKAQKIELFTKLGIGIADIIYQCERKANNSLDNNLVNIVYNPEMENIISNKNLKKVFFSSRFVENQYRRVFKNLVKDYPEVELITLPSPSPRYAKLSKSEKIEIYKTIMPKLK